MLSAPSPPSTVSAPSSALMLSEPGPPSITSSPAPPTITSEPSPPQITSSSPRPKMMSAPARPSITSGPDVPRSVSLPGVPTSVGEAHSEGGGVGSNAKAIAPCSRPWLAEIPPRASGCKLTCTRYAVPASSSIDWLPSWCPGRPSLPSTSAFPPFTVMRGPNSPKGLGPV
jgi:hypothetical protein